MRPSGFLQLDVITALLQATAWNAGAQAPPRDQRLAPVVYLAYWGVIGIRTWA